MAFSKYNCQYTFRSIPMGTNCTSIFTDLFYIRMKWIIYQGCRQTSWNILVDFLESLLNIYVYILSLNNYKLYITTYFINIYYPSEIKENGDQDVRYICIFIYLESCKKRQSSSNIYGKRDDFSCSIVNFSCFLFIYPPDMAFTYPNWYAMI